MVLVSGSREYWNQIKSLDLNVPSLFTFEGRSNPKLKGGNLSSFRNFLNGGCLDYKTIVEFQELKTPVKLTNIKRTLGDFIDFSEQPHTIFIAKDSNTSEFLTTNSTLSVKELKKQVKLPSYMHSSGWGTRFLSRKEIFAIWGLLDLEPSGLDIDSLVNIPPIQVLSLIINSYLSSKSVSKANSVSQQMKIHPPSSSTHFEEINTTINDDWIDVSLVEKSSRKEDKAPVPSSLWDNRVLLSFPGRTGVPNLIIVLRSFLLRIYRKRLTKSLLLYLRSSFHSKWTNYVNGSRTHMKGGDLDKSIRAGKDVIAKIAHSSWFEWLKGSSLIFWKWHDFRNEARDGFINFMLKSELKEADRKFSKGVPPSDPLRQRLYYEKISRLLETGYIEEGFVRWDVPFFDVAKGESDIRLVFHGTKFGLNNSVWAPSFFLPTSKSLARIVDINTYQLDMDVGEMFLNFPLHTTMRTYCGVNLLGFDNLPLDKKQKRQRWTRLWFGFKPSPHGAVRFLSIAEELARGDPLDVKNPFFWDSIRMNLPCSSDFDPTAPWICKWNSKLNRIAGDFVVFVDDMRVCGSSVENCWQCGRRLSSVLQSLGIQEAARKRKPPSLDAEAWAGSVVKTEDCVEKTITQSKWNKAKEILGETRSKIGSPERPNKLLHKFLEVSRGFLNHLGLTYPIILPYLRGWHNTIDSWRDDRDLEGWKNEKDTPETNWLDLLSYNLVTGKISEEDYDELCSYNVEGDDPPTYVLPAPRLFEDLEILEAIFQEDLPARYPIRHRCVVEVYYGFFDASGRGLGSMIQGTDESKVTIRIGVWSTSEAEENSSNWKEFSNLVNGVEDEAKKGRLFHAMLFLFTDNSTVEAGVAKGNSPSPKLHELIKRLRALEMKYCFEVFVIHVSGSRMITQGTDGLSRGSLKSSALSSRTIKEYAPLHLTAIQRSPTLKQWIKSWAGSDPLFLEPRHWFVEGHDLRYVGLTRNLEIESGTYIWTPPPAVADVAIEQLRCAVLKRQQSLHILIVPKLFFSLWRRQLHKCSDIILYLPAGLSIWPSEMHEPLIISFIFPFIRYQPWCIRGTPKLYAMARKMQALWKTKDVDGGSDLRQFLLEIKRLPTMPEHVVREVLYLQRRHSVSNQE